MLIPIAVNQGAMFVAVVDKEAVAGAAHTKLSKDTQETTINLCCFIPFFFDVIVKKYDRTVNKCSSFKKACNEIPTT